MISENGIEILEGGEQGVVALALAGETLKIDHPGVDLRRGHGILLTGDGGVEEAGLAAPAETDPHWTVGLEEG